MAFRRWELVFAYEIATYWYQRGSYRHCLSDTQFLNALLNSKNQMNSSRRVFQTFQKGMAYDCE